MGERPQQIEQAEKATTRIKKGKRHTPTGDGHDGGTEYLALCDFGVTQVPGGSFGGQ